MVYKMDISAITALNNVNGTATVSPTSLTGMLAEKEKKAEDHPFDPYHCRKELWSDGYHRSSDSGSGTVHCQNGGIFSVGGRSRSD